MKTDSTVMLVKIAGMVVLGFFLSFWVYLGLGEMSSGDWGGVSHLVVVAVALALMALAWNRPRTWGAVILIVGVLFGLRYGIPALGSSQFPTGVLLMSVPFLISGILLLLAGVMDRGTSPVRKKRY